MGSEEYSERSPVSIDANSMGLVGLLHSVGVLAALVHYSEMDHQQRPSLVFAMRPILGSLHALEPVPVSVALVQALTAPLLLPNLLSIVLFILLMLPALLLLPPRRRLLLLLLPRHTSTIS